MTVSLIFGVAGGRVVPQSGMLPGRLEQGMPLETSLADLNQSANHFASKWPVSEVVLLNALNTGLSAADLAERFGVTVEDVVRLCDEYDLQSCLGES